MSITSFFIASAMEFSMVSFLMFFSTDEKVILRELLKCLGWDQLIKKENKMLWHWAIQLKRIKHMLIAIILSLVFVWRIIAVFAVSAIALFVVNKCVPEMSPQAE